MALRKEIKDQFMVGNSLLIAPLFAGETERRVVLPKGKWYDNSVDDQKRGAVMRTGFDHDLYTRMQSEHIRSRIAV